MGLTAAEVREFALSLPETIEGEHGARPAFRVRRNLFAVIQPGDGEVLLLVDRDERQALVAEAPDAFHEIRNNQGVVVQSWITVDLARADATLVFEVIEDGWRQHAPKRAVAALELARGST